MRILFWNVNRKDRTPLLAHAAQEHGLDIIVLLEFASPSSTLLNALAASTGSTYHQFAEPAGALRKRIRGIRIFSRLPVASLVPLHGTVGPLTMLEVKPPVGQSFILAAAHLASKRNAKPGDQFSAVARLPRLIEGVEAKVGHTRTIVLGDLNMNPFEEPLISSEGFHAVMSREIASNVTRKVDKEIRPFFYNPMWRHIGALPPDAPGTYFLADSSYVCYFWHMLDQVLLRPSLFPYFKDKDLSIVTMIGTTSLLKNGRPDKTIGSDHLPVLFTLDLLQQAVA